MKQGFGDLSQPAFLLDCKVMDFGMFGVVWSYPFMWGSPMHETTTYKQLGRSKVKRKNTGQAQFHSLIYLFIAIPAFGTETSSHRPWPVVCVWVGEAGGGGGGLG